MALSARPVGSGPPRENASAVLAKTDNALALGSGDVRAFARKRIGLEDVFLSANDLRVKTRQVLAET